MEFINDLWDKFCILDFFSLFMRCNFVKCFVKLSVISLCV